jgi:hypothetical protein
MCARRSAQHARSKAISVLQTVTVQSDSEKQVVLHATRQQSAATPRLNAQPTPTARTYTGLTGHVIPQSIARIMEQTQIAWTVQE